MKNSSVIRSALTSIRVLGFSCLLAGVGTALAGVATAAGSAAPSRVLAPVNPSDRISLAGDTPRWATASADQGLVEGQLPLRHLFLVLQRSAAQEAALADFNARQYDRDSVDYHHWLQPEEFGLEFGPNDSDIAAITAWLKGSGLQVLHVSQGRINIEFSGTAAQVQSAFNIELHRYLVKGASQISNDRDPQIPRALSAVVAGVGGLNDFPLKSGTVQGPLAKLDASGRLSAYSPPSPEQVVGAGTRPDYTVDDFSFQYEFVTPYDYATIYNSLPLWNASKPIVGTGISITVVGDNDVNLDDISTYRSSLGLPANKPIIEYVGADPKGSSIANTLELELAGAAAPGADLVLVVPENGNLSSGADNGNGGITTGGFLSAITYIVDKNTTNIVTSGYALCELLLGASNNKMINQIWQEGATSGMSIFASTGSVGSSGCASGDYLDVDTQGLQVSGTASSPYVTAVGGTDFTWQWISGGGTAYWNASNDSHDASAKGYIPESPWNVSCANAFLQVEYFTLDGAPRYPEPVDICNAYANAPGFNGILTDEGAGGGVSSCSMLNSSGDCTGYGKPSWQAATGVPADGKRDVPDVSLFASAGFPFTRDAFGIIQPPVSYIHSSVVLICYSGTKPGSTAHPCKYDGNYNDVIFQGSGGTSAATAYWAGILALVEQKEGGARQGLINSTLYKMYEKESLSACESRIVAAGNSCVFYDIASPGITNAQPCAGTIASGSSHPNCDYTQSSSPHAQYEYGILTGYAAATGYDQATGLGSVNVTNLVDKWPTVSPTPTVSISATSLAFGNQAEGGESATKTVTVSNTGTVSVSLTSITLTGQADDFVLTKSCGSSLAAGASCTLTVGFKPVSTGAKAAAISIADNASGSPQTVALSDTGTAAGSAPTLKLSTTALSFGDESAGSSSAAKTVTVTNGGTGSLTLTSITLTGQADDFVFTKGCGTSLAAGASCALTVAFKPVSAGSKSATISIADNAKGSPQSVALTGTGN